MQLDKQISYLSFFPKNLPWFLYRKLSSGVERLAFALAQFESKREVETLKIDKIIAKGGQALVLQSTYRGQKVAVKIDNTFKGKANQSPLLIEHKILSTLCHPNIVKSLDFDSKDCPRMSVQIPESLKISQTEKESLEPHSMMIMELCEKDLFNLVENTKGMFTDLLLLKHLFKQICSGVNHLH